MVATLSGRRVLVVGASAGIGRSFARQAIRAGADVIVAARRIANLEALVSEAGSCVRVALDISDAGGFAGLSEHLAAGPPVDLVMSSAGSASLRHVADTTPADWDSVMRTNVSGFNELVRTALPHLAPAAVVAALSSETVQQPREALAAYAASKAALESSIRSWRLEHPGRRFTCIRVGATQPTEFGHTFDGAILGSVLERWASHGLLQEEFMVTDDVATVLMETLAVVVAHPGVALEDVVLRSPSAIAGSVLPAIERTVSGKQ